MGLSSFLKLRRELLAGASAAVHTLSEHARGWPAARWTAVLRTTYEQGKRDSLQGICRAHSPSTTCQQKALSVWHTRALLPTIPGHFKGVLLRSKSSGLPTGLSHHRTLDANISRIFVHLSNSWKSPPTNPALFFHPICQRGRRTESRASSWYTDLHVLDANPPGLCATWKDSPRKTDYIPATSKWSGFAKHSLFSCLEAFLKAWLCNKGASPPRCSQTHRLPIRLRYMFLGPARKPEWLAVSPDEILKKSL